MVRFIRFPCFLFCARRRDDVRAPTRGRSPPVGESLDDLPCASSSGDQRRSSRSADSAPRGGPSFLALGFLQHRGDALYQDGGQPLVGSSRTAHSRRSGALARSRASAARRRKASCLRGRAVRAAQECLVDSAEWPSRLRDDRWKRQVLLDRERRVDPAVVRDIAQTACARAYGGEWRCPGRSSESTRCFAGGAHDAPEQRGLAGAVPPDERDELALAHMQ